MRGRERAPDLIEGHALWAACHLGDVPRCEADAMAEWLVNWGGHHNERQGLGRPRLEVTVTDTHGIGKSRQRAGVFV